LARPLSKVVLRRRIISALRRQGYRVRNGAVSAPRDLTKNRIRDLHAVAVEHKLREAERIYGPIETELLSHFAGGEEVDPTRIVPQVIQIRSNSLDELLFRYASLHWSIPVSSGYGRRIRFLVRDTTNGKVIGLIGLCDPVYNLGVRDKWVGWSSDAKMARLQNVMEAFVLGAVPPYNELLCGKLVASLAASTEIREAFSAKYQGVRTRITGRTLDGHLALITTTSALGRSSVYNRLKVAGRPLFESIGFTRGAGEFHFANGTYAALRDYAGRYCSPTYRKPEWGEGFRNRREVVKKCLPKIGISTSWMNHGVSREVFAVHVSHNAREFLRGNDSEVTPNTQTAQTIAEAFRNRWLLPRIETRQSYLEWTREQWRLYGK
jgi:hypothetical protein